jgi:hypothetical protein
MLEQLSGDPLAAMIRMDHQIVDVQKWSSGKCRQAEETHSQTYRFEIKEGQVR